MLYLLAVIGVALALTVFATVVSLAVWALVVGLREDMRVRRALHGRNR